MNLTVSIESAELRFRQILEDFFSSVYHEGTLYSHGIDHHRRVWSYGKELLPLIRVQSLPSNQQLPSKLIISCYLHDIGMSINAGIHHGKHSRELCIEFLKKHNLPADEYTDVLEAIENHDNKEYKDSKPGSDLLKILSVADDLDAFGYIGIYRFSEIYLMRGINQEVLGDLIIENASKRFGHFEKYFGFDNVLVKKHRERFKILVGFFTGYNKQVKSYSFDDQNPTGYCGVLKLFIGMIRDKKGLIESFSEAEKYYSDPLIRWYFEGLKSEITLKNPES
jgi:hypothetical protein